MDLSHQSPMFPCSRAFFHFPLLLAILRIFCDSFTTNCLQPIKNPDSCTIWSRKMVVVDDIRSSYFLFVFLILFQMGSSVTDSEALLTLKKSFTNAQGFDSWKPETNPCDKNNRWKGVACHHGNVGNLNLGHSNLSGSIDVDALVQIPGLRSLGLMDNSFSGPIPEFNRLGALKSIYLTGNQFSGEIPSDYFAKMSSLKKVWLSGNKFTGEIPSSLAQLSHLIELHLENNQFSGTIPEFKQPTLMSLNISNNNLTGEIPSSLSRFNQSSFEGNPGLCGDKLGNPCSQSNNGSDSHQQYTSSQKKSSIWFLIASIVIFVLVFLGIYVLHRRQRSRRDVDVMERENVDEPERVPSLRDLTPSQNRSGLSREGSSGKSLVDIVMVNAEIGDFGLADLMRAPAEVLANGALGSAYKVTMSNGLTVVVKRIREMDKIGKDGFDAHLRRLGRLKHRNVLTPLAYHFQKDEKLLVYEYIPQGSLLYLLHGDRGPSHAELNWSTRLKIIQGIARGLVYLHSELASCDLPHGDLKSSNVLLGPNYEPLLADFGYSSLININQAKQSLFAYRSPEAAEYQQVSHKCDVYSLGIVILELLTGKFPSQYADNGTGGTDIVQWVKSAIAGGREAEVVDPEIASSINISPDDVERLLHIGAACTESNPEQRLDIREAISRIEAIQVDIGGQEIRPFQELPTFREGYSDSAANQSQRSNTQEGYSESTGRSRNSITGEKSSSGISDTFSFEES